MNKQEKKQLELILAGLNKISTNLLFEETFDSPSPNTPFTGMYNLDTGELDWIIRKLSELIGGK